MKKIFLILLCLSVAQVAFAQWAPSPSDTYQTSVQNPSLYTGTNANATAGSQSTGVPGSVSGYTPLEPLSLFNGGKYANFADYLATVYKLAITIGGLIAVVMLVTGGVRYMLSESFTDKSAAKSRIVNALWGLLILVGSFLILYTINPNLLSFNLSSLTPVNQKPSNFNLGSSGSDPTLTPEQKKQLIDAAPKSTDNCKTVQTALDTHNTSAVQAIYDIANSFKSWYNDLNTSPSDVINTETQYVNDCKSAGLL